MKRYFALALILTLICFNCSFAEAALDTSAQTIWQRVEYVDEFELGTGDYYVANIEPIIGKFSNSATEDSRLEVMILTDRNNFGFFLYEYGNSKVINPYSEHETYNVTLLDSMRNKTYWTGYMKSGSDRILFEDDARIFIMQALQNNPTVSFYIQEQDSPTTNYLFTIENTIGYKEAIDWIYGDEYSLALQLYENGEYEAARSMFASIREYADAEFQEEKCQNAMLAQKYECAIKLMENKQYVEAIEVFASLMGYSDSVEQIEICKNAAVQYAGELIANNQFDDAALLLNTLENCDETSNLLMECHYRWAIYELNNGNNRSAFYGFVTCGSYEDSEAYAKKAATGVEPKDIYELGMTYYNWGNYETATKYFEWIPEYSDVQQLLHDCEVMLNYQGTYKYSILSSDKGWFLVLVGNKLMRYDFRNAVTNFRVNTIALDEVDDKLALVDAIWKGDTTGSHTYYYLSTDEKGSRCIEVDYFNHGRDMAIYEEYSRYTIDTLNNKSSMAEDVPEPYVGMTAEQVMLSAWGTPKSIEIINNTGGIAERWTFAGKYYTDRVIYMENGIVVGFEE